MWNDTTFCAPLAGQPALLHALSESVQYLARIHGSLSMSALRAQAEAVARSAEEVQSQIALIEDPEAAAATAHPGWGPLIGNALALMAPGVDTKAISVHVLRAQAEYLKATHAYYLAAIAAIERSAAASGAPAAHSERVNIT